MSIDADPGTQFDASLTLGPAQTGLVGTLAVSIIDAGQQTYAVARTTEGISEFPAGSGIYGAKLTAPLAPGMYVVLWDTAQGGVLTPQNSWTEPLQITIQDPTFPGGWSWTPWGWAQPDDESQFEISTAPPGSNPIPAAADVRAMSKLDFGQYGYCQDTGPGGLQELVDQAESAFYRITGQELDAIDPKDAPLVRRVIRGMTEQMAMESSADVMETQSDWDLIVSFSAGPYNETRRSPEDMFKARMLNPVPWISQALWSLLSEERYGYYLSFFSGQNIPAWREDDVFWEDGQIMGKLWGPAPGYFWGA